MNININRIMNDIEILSKFTKFPGEEGCTRFSYSEEDIRARNYIISEMKKIGLKVIIDKVGNIRGRLEGRNKNESIIMSGSHLDTVYKGGKFDGVLGVVSALEVARVLVESEFLLKSTYEVIVFTEEEGSNFGNNLVGSKILTGKYDYEEIKNIRDSNDESLFEKIKKLDLNPENLEKSVLMPSQIKGMIELHIEQGSVLDKEGISVGIVEGIVGLKWLEIEIKGEANHAGATPMHLRKDPMVAASQIIGDIPKIIKEKEDSSIVATVGKILCQPNAINIIPEKVKFIIDLRGMNSKKLDAIIIEIKNRLKGLDLEGFKCNINLLTEAKEIESSKNILKDIEDIAKEEKISYKSMYSGANHDTSIMAEITEVAMIFVPSVAGRSHCPEEYTKQEDIEKGGQLLLKSIMKLITK